MDTAPQVSTESPVQVPYARQLSPRRRSLGRWIAVSGVVVVLLAVGALGLRGSGLLERIWGKVLDDSALYVVKPVDLRISLTEDGELKPRNSVDIKCELEGQSTILSVVDESKKVKKGDLLVELASDEIQDRLDSEEIQLRQIESSFEAAEQSLKLQRSESESQIKRSEIALEVAELELRRYVEGDFQGALKSAEINIKQTEMDIKRKQDELQKNRELAERGFVTKTKLEELEFDLEKAQMTLEQNNLQKHILLEYEKPKNETQKQSDVDQARQELERERQRATSREKQALAKVEEQQALLAMRVKRVDKLRTQLEKCKIFAPVDGIVQYPGDDMMWRRGSGNRITPGEKVYESQTLVVLPDTSQMIVTTRIHEADRHLVQVDVPCVVKVPAVPGRTFTGRVIRIAKFADTANRWLNPELKEHSTEILLDETAAPLSPGDSAEIKILIEDVSGVLAVPVQCVYARGPKSYVFVRRGGATDYTEVQLGRATDSMVEIKQGLRAGDRALMHVDDKLVATLPAPRAVERSVEMPAAPPVRAPADADHGQSLHGQQATTQSSDG